MTDQSLDLLGVAVEAARAAAAIIRDAEPRVRDIVWREKSATDFVSDVDLAAEMRILDVVRHLVPHAAVLAEETATTLPASRLKRGVVFVVDPLDGTTNFLHGYPEYAVSIGVLVEGALAAAVVLDVPGDECFTATDGGGARLDGVPIRVSSTDNPQRALIGSGFPFKNTNDIAPYLLQMSRVMAGVSGVRRPGAASIDLASVACGRFDAFWETMLAPWDVAAGILLIREAGGVVTDLSGAPAVAGHTGIVAGNPTMHGWLMQTLGSP